MPFIGHIAFFVFAVVTTVVAYSAASLRSKLQGQPPCQRWFGFLIGMIAAATVFVTWTGVHGLGAVEPSYQGVAYALFGGTVWGGIFSYINVLILWRAFDSPSKNYAGEHEQMMNTDVDVLLSRAVRRILAFRPIPAFEALGVLPWAIFIAAIVLPMLWAYAFCLLTWLTEGAPGVEPVMPIKR